jgi:hypothetical protein
MTSINLAPPVILGTSESYRGSFLFLGSRLSVALCDVTLHDYPGLGDLRYIDRCVFFSDEVRTVCTDPIELPSDGNPSIYNFTIGAIRLQLCKGDVADDGEVDVFATSAKLILPSSAAVSSSPLTEVQRLTFDAFLNGSFNLDCFESGGMPAES